MQVIATKRGYDGIKVRDEGEEFTMPNGATGSWFKPKVEAPKEALKADAGKGKGPSAPLA